MPYLEVKTNVPVNRKKRELINHSVAQAISIIPKEKPEFLMSSFDECQPMIFSEDSEKPAAIITLYVLDSVYQGDNCPIMEKIGTAVTEVVAAVLDIDPDRIYFTIGGFLHWQAGGLDITKGILK